MYYFFTKKIFLELLMLLLFFFFLIFFILLYSCLNNLTSLNITLNSNFFHKNNAMNGGAVFFSNSNNDEKNINIYVENNIFKENIANYYGGAINLKFDTLNIKKYNNNDILDNIAGVLGGGVYLTNLFFNKSVSFNVYNNSRIENNKVGSYSNNYSSRPTSIILTNAVENNILNVKTGEYISLNFKLLDVFNNTIIDTSNYFSVITLRLLLDKKSTNQNKRNTDINYNIGYKLLGNICNFINGN